MFPLFITCHSAGPMHSRGEEWEALRRRFREQLETTHEDLPERVGWALQNYGDWYHRDTAKSAGKILAPAGSWFWVRLDAGESLSAAVWMRQIEIARYGFPDLYEAELAVLNSSRNEWHCISERVPAHTPAEAIERFQRALTSPAAMALAERLGDSVPVKIFGAASSPESLSELLDYPAPTLADLASAAAQIQAATTTLRDVFKRWEGTDALQYLHRRGKLADGRQPRLDMFIKMASELADGFSGIEPPELRRGRRIRGGRNNLVARTIAQLWSRCGLGEPKLSPQSRFIRACSVVLPWHGIHKADVSQFMRGEIQKKHSGTVVIG